MNTAMEDNERILGFSGKYSPFSNFDMTPFVHNVGTTLCTFKSVEHGFQGFKTLDKHWMGRILFASTPSEAKKLGRKCPMRPDWESVKVEVMETLVFAKFSQNKHLADLLLSTGNKYLEETNWWRDTFWGVCNGVGSNELGKCLMRVRERLRNP